MANVKVVVDYTIKDGQSLVFKAPCDCKSVTGLIVYYKELIDNEITQVSKVFTFRDANKNDLSNINNLFTEGAYVHVILDTINNHAFLQNADTNAYIEQMLCTKLVTYTTSFVASTDGQTTFTLDFDPGEDTVFVQSGRTMLFPELDFTVQGSNVVLVEGVPAGRTIGVHVFRNIVNTSSLEGMILPISQGGTGATSAEEALTNLGAAPASHTHSPEEIGVLPDIVEVISSTNSIRTIIQDSDNITKFFTNNSNTTDFPVSGGSGILLGGPNSRPRNLLYTNGENLWSGIYSNGSLTWSNPSGGVNIDEIRDQLFEITPNDLTAGSSPLANNKLCFVYEE